MNDTDVSLFPVYFENTLNKQHNSLNSDAPLNKTSHTILLQFNVVLFCKCLNFDQLTFPAIYL